LVALGVVIVTPILDDHFHITKAVAARNVDFILHVAIEALLRSIVPTLGSPRHGLTEVGVL
jgi:hypothetical protein